MITGDQLLCHAIGDYVLQSDWMANEKTKRSIAALCHVLTYGLPFLFLRPSVLAMIVIVSTHFVIDRWRLARYVVWTKNFLAPMSRNFGLLFDGYQVMPSAKWASCSRTGYPALTPDWLAVWLLIIADNVMHVAINGLALKYL